MTPPASRKSPGHADGLESAAAAGEPDRAAVRRRAMLDAARELFFERGFEGTSVSDIVGLSGGSLATLYQTFGSKEGLFESILGEVTAELVAPLETPEFERLPLEQALRHFGERFLERVLCPAALAWHRMCITEGTKFPELRAALVRTGPGRVRERLAAYLAAQAAAGRLRIEDPGAAAAQFLALVKSENHLAAVCGETASTSPRRIRDDVRRAVDLFLHGCAIEGSDEDASPAVESGRPARRSTRSSR